MSACSEIVGRACDGSCRRDPQNLCPYAFPAKREPAFPVSAQDAFAQAAWWTRYALDALPSEHLDPSIEKAAIAHGKAALVQHDAIRNAVTLAQT